MQRCLSRVADIIVVAGIITSCCAPPKEEPETAPANWNVLSPAVLAGSHGRIDFTAHVRPVLEAKCLMCHQRDVLPFFSLETRDRAFGSDQAGSRIVPGRPEKSRLLMHVHGTTPGLKAMPPVGDRLTPDEKRILAAWIEQGAHWPSGTAGELDPHADYRR